MGGYQHVLRGGMCLTEKVKHEVLPTQQEVGPFNDPNAFPVQVSPRQTVAVRDRGADTVS